LAGFWIDPPGRAGFLNYVSMEESPPAPPYFNGKEQSPVAVSFLFYLKTNTKHYVINIPITICKLQIVIVAVTFDEALF
jgi:hypothetical protein